MSIRGGDQVPYLDLAAHHLAHRDEFTRAIGDVVQSGDFAGGRYVERFESAYAKFCGVRRALGVGSGTEALWLALKACGVGPGDEVITVPMTFIATAEAISMTGATPVFVDIDSETFTMDPSRLEAALSRRTKAVLPVHLFGQMSDMKPIMAFAKDHGLVVIEDASQAHGAEIDGRRAGAIGNAGCFSFYPGKNLGAFGEAGAVVTNSEEVGDRVAVLRNHGQTERHNHQVRGWNGRMDGIQAAVLEIKLRHLDRNNAMRAARAREYRELLADIGGISVPQNVSGASHVHHVFALRCRERDRMLEGLRSEGIACGIHYPVPIHLQRAYADLEYQEGDFPVSEACAREFLSLPIFPELSSEAVRRVAGVIRRLAAEN